jgi:hypothetical protein
LLPKQPLTFCFTSDKAFATALKSGLRQRIIPGKFSNPGLALMQFDVYIEDHRIPLEISQELIESGQEFYARMDADMDRGWQMGRDWIEQPDRLQRCQIAADRLHTALHNQRDALALLMAGYILSRTPGATGARVDTSGEMAATEILA